MGQDADLYPQATPMVYELPGWNGAPAWLVPAGRVLRIHPGTTVQGGYTSQLQVQGRLEALGTVSQPITLTSAEKDYSYQWRGLFFDGGTGLLQHTTLQYGRTATTRPANVAAVNVQDGQVRLENSRIEKAWLDGMYVLNSHVSLSNTVLSETGISSPEKAALYAGAGSDVTLDGCEIVQNYGHGVELGAADGSVEIVRSLITGNRGDGLRNDAGGTFIAGGVPERANQIYPQGQESLGARQVGTAGYIVAYWNWWGDDSGPTHPTNPDGHGAPISDGVLYRPWVGVHLVYLPAVLKP
jgi:hypothetical protein